MKTHLILMIYSYFHSIKCYLDYDKRAQNKQPPCPVPPFTFDSQQPNNRVERTATAVTSGGRQMLWKRHGYPTYIVQLTPFL